VGTLSLQDDVRNDLDVEVFNIIGKTVTLKSQGSPYYNDRGELENDDFTETSITAVPFNINNKDQTFQSFGNIEEGDMFMALRYDQTINIGDVITVESEDWEVKQIEVNYLPDNVVTIVQLFRRTA